MSVCIIYKNATVEKNYVSEGIDIKKTSTSK